MNEREVQNVCEAALLAAGRPLTAEELRDLFDEFERPAMADIEKALGVLVEDYTSRGIELVEVSSGWRIQVRAALSAPVSRLWQERPAKYSRALLETLALIAYRQPITRGEIEDIRGVAVNPNIIKTLSERNWVRVVGHREVPGRPELLGTTRDFLDHFNLKSLDELPTLAQLRDLESLGVQLDLTGGGGPGMPEPASAPVPSMAHATTPADTQALAANAEHDEDEDGEGDEDEGSDVQAKEGEKLNAALESVESPAPEPDVQSVSESTQEPV